MERRDLRAHEENFNDVRKNIVKQSNLLGEEKKIERAESKKFVVKNYEIISYHGERSVKLETSAKICNWEFDTKRGSF